jgi:hypothetical protein
LQNCMFYINTLMLQQGIGATKMGQYAHPTGPGSPDAPGLESCQPVWPF